MALRSPVATMHSTQRAFCDARRHLIHAGSHLAPRCTRQLNVSRPVLVCKAQNKDNNNLEDYVEVKVDSVRVSQGSSVVFLRILDGDGATLPVHIAEPESNALMKEISNQRNMRPNTHDTTKSMMLKVGFRVSKILITEIVANTYYARIHLARNQANADDEEVDVDARPSDAINLAVRFGAPMYVNKRVAEAAAQHSHQPAHTSFAGQSETHADIVKSVRQALSTYEDPTIMVQLQKELAIKEDRFEDAQVFQEQIAHEMTHNPLLRLVVAMETAMNDGRFDEAARLRDEYREVTAKKSVAEHKFKSGF